MTFELIVVSLFILFAMWGLHTLSQVSKSHLTLTRSIIDRLSVVEDQLDRIGYLVDHEQHTECDECACDDDLENTEQEQWL